MSARRKYCKICKINKEIDYKDTKFLSQFIDRRGKILPRSLTGNCSKHQRMITKAIKRARVLALMPFTR
ncbi:MAG: 30S ribosomal protein S18 [Elusimicrobiota bacterium]